MELVKFIVAAKAASYVGGGHHALHPSRKGAHDLTFTEGRLSYLDSHFGGTDFIGQETVWLDDEPLWAMNYYGRVLDPGRIDATRAGAVIKEALATLYREGRFLGGFKFQHKHGLYVDENCGSVKGFEGIERIYVNEIEAYRLSYHGGRILP